MVFVSYCPKSSQNYFLSKKIRIQFWICVSIEPNWLRNKKVMEKPRFDVTNGLRSQMASHIQTMFMTSLFFCFEEFLAYTLFLPSLIVVTHQMAELHWGFSPSPYIIGVFLTPSKMELNYNSVFGKYYISHLLDVF